MSVIKIPSNCYGDSNQVTHSKVICRCINKVCVCVYVIQLELNCICMWECFWNRVVRPATEARLPLTMFVEINSFAALLSTLARICQWNCFTVLSEGPTNKTWIYIIYMLFIWLCGSYIVYMYNYTEFLKIFFTEDNIDNAQIYFKCLVTPFTSHFLFMPTRVATL